MDFYIVDRGNFDKFYIQNFTKFIDNNLFIIKYELFNSYILRYYRDLEVEGISIGNSDNKFNDYIAFIVHNEEKIRQVRFLRTIIDNQKKENRKK
jgi:hypothetical protein